MRGANNPDEAATEGGGVDRRTVLRTLGVTTTVGAIAGCEGTENRPNSRARRSGTVTSGQSVDTETPGPPPITEDPEYISRVEALEEAQAEYREALDEVIETKNTVEGLWREAELALWASQVASGEGEAVATRQSLLQSPFGQARRQDMSLQEYAMEIRSAATPYRDAFDAFEEARDTLDNSKAELRSFLRERGHAWGLPPDVHPPFSPDDTGDAPTPVVESVDAPTDPRAGEGDFVTPRPDEIGEGYVTPWVHTGGEGTDHHTQTETQSPTSTPTTTESPPTTAPEQTTTEPTTAEEGVAICECVEGFIKIKGIGAGDGAGDCTATGHGHAWLTVGRIYACQRNGGETADDVWRRIETDSFGFFPDENVSATDITDGVVATVPGRIDHTEGPGNGTGEAWCEYGIFGLDCAKAQQIRGRLLILANPDRTVPPNYSALPGWLSPAGTGGINCSTWAVAVWNHLMSQHSDCPRINPGEERFSNLDMLTPCDDPRLRPNILCEVLNQRNNQAG